MTEAEGGRWELARKRVIVRWQEILKRIDAQDEGGVLGLANVMDEFCEEAIATRLSVLHGLAPPVTETTKLPSAMASIGTRCLFCRGFEESGGCFGMLAELNRLVMARQWEDARQVAETYVARLRSMTLPDQPEPLVH
jgi:hypothetical protein